MSITLQTLCTCDGCSRSSTTPHDARFAADPPSGWVVLHVRLGNRGDQRALTFCPDCIGTAALVGEAVRRALRALAGVEG